MEPRLTQFILIVKDQDDALEFYTKKLGFEKTTDSAPPGGYRWVTVGPKGQDLELALFQAGSQDASPWARDWKPGNNPPIVMRVDGCAKFSAEPKPKGVRFDAEPKEYPWGVSATSTDPDGDYFSINQPPKEQAWS